MNTEHLVREALRGYEKKSVDFSQFAQHLENEILPDVSPDSIGKYRLGLFLRRKFGAGYGNHPVAKMMLSHFETTKKALSLVR